MKKLLIGLFLFFLTMPCFAQKGLGKVRIDLFDGGQDSFNLSDILESNQSQSAQNVVLSKKGQLSKRKGQEIFIASHGTVAFTGLGRFDPDTSTSYMMVASGVNVIRALSSSTEWTTVNSDDPISSGYDTEFIQANDLLFILNGQDPTHWYDGTTFTEGTDNTSSPPTASTGAWLNNYLFLSGNDVNEDWVYFSNSLEPEIFTSTDLMKINTGDGQRVQRVESFRLFELIVYKERSIFVLDITGSFDDGAWTVQPISKSVGCIAPRSVVSLGNDQWFLSSNPIAVRSLARSEYDKILVNMVSTPIQDIFDGTGTVTINKTYIDNACAVLFDSKYLLALTTGSSTINNTVAAYDFITNSWYVIDGWYPAAWIIFDNKLYYVDARDAKVTECFTGTTGDLTHNSSQPTVAIEYEYISRNIDFDNPENFKQLDAMEVEFETAGDYDVTLSINLDHDGFQEIGTINLSGDVITLPVNLPFTLTSGGVAKETFQLQEYGEFRKMQIKIIQDGLSEVCNLYRATLFAQEKPWRRE